jgi:PTS system sucrose-specific IIC component
MTTDAIDRFRTLADAILSATGGAQNLRRHFHCMTRLRISLIDPALADLSALNSLPGVLGVVAGDPLQIVIGPGLVKRASEALSEALSDSQWTEASQGRPAARIEEKQPFDASFCGKLRRFSHR